MDAYTRKQIDRITLNVIHNRLKEEGREMGREEGQKEARRAEKTAFVANLLRETKLNIQKIASLAGVSTTFVKQIAASHN
jgi:predicted transposase YdaD